MEEQRIRERKRKSVTNIDDFYDIERVQEEQLHFVPCTIEWLGEYLTYTYTVTSLYSFNVLDLPIIDVLRILIGVARLQNIYNHYQFTLHPNNLYYTRDTVVKIKERDIRVGETIDFLVQYKSLIGVIFLKKYSYEDIVQGGLIFLKEHRQLKSIYVCQTVESVVRILQDWYDRERMQIVRREKDTRRSIRVLKVILVIYTISIIGISILIL